MSDISGKNIVLGVCGGIAAYKTCALVSMLKKRGCNVDVIMTKNATEFVAPLSFEALSGRPVVTDMFSRTAPWEVEHVALAKKADCFVIAPATANAIGKIACGIADDMLSTTVMATKAPLIIAPAMNTNMYENPVVTENIDKLKSRGALVLDAGHGRLACGDTGKGKMAEPEAIAAAIEDALTKKDLVGKRILVTAGATMEKLDPVRCITNFSSGKMGCALAERAKRRGALVTLVLGKHSCKTPDVCVIDAESTSEMRDCVLSRVDDNDVFIMAAAPCDYRPETYSDDKIKAGGLQINLIKNGDISKELGAIKADKRLVIFSAETRDLVKNATAKMHDKKADFVVANDVTAHGAGFNHDTNVVTIIDKNEIIPYGMMSKDDVADIILDKILAFSH